MCRSRKSMRNQTERLKHFLVKTSSESLPSRRNDTTLALLQPQPLFLSRFHSFLLRGRKFVFVSKSGRLALKKNVCAFGTYRRNRIESGRACVATVFHPSPSPLSISRFFLIRRSNFRVCIFLTLSAFGPRFYPISRSSSL